MQVVCPVCNHVFNTEPPGIQVHEHIPEGKEEEWEIIYDTWRRERNTEQE